MSNLDFSPTYGNSVPVQKSSSGRWWLLACGGCLAIIVLICCCCGAVGVFALRQPVGLATFWGGLISAEQYDSTSWAVCEGSQADQYTEELKMLGAKFTEFNAVQDAGDDVTATATLDVGGKLTAWEGTFFTKSGGTFGRCIDRIEVITGGVGIPSSDSPFATPTPK